MSRHRASLLFVLAAGVLVAGTQAALADGLPDPIPGSIAPTAVSVGLQVVTDTLTAPVEGVAAPGDARHRLYIADQTGQITLVDGTGRNAPVQVADLSGLLVDNLAEIIPGLPYDERGLLGLAFPPDFARSHLAYTFTSENADMPPDFTTLGVDDVPDSQSVVREWRVRNADTDHATFDMSTGRELMRIDKPQFNHNGGDLAFGPNGALYISVGDGGNADDQGTGHDPGGNGQSLAPGNVLGKILRIDPHGTNSANGKYGIPLHNPFADNPGADEIWAYGFRNPYRMSFDHQTGRLFVADVGQNDVEEIDVVTHGRDYGWPIKEGTFLFDNGGSRPGFVTVNSPGVPAGLTDPVAQYDHTAPGGVRCGTSPDPASCNGIAVVGGYVYRGRGLHGLYGAYIAGDYSRQFATPDGRLWVIRDHTVRALRVPGGSPGIAVFGFAQDLAGDLYVLGNHSGLLTGSAGTVLRLTAA